MKSVKLEWQAVAFPALVLVSIAMVSVPTGSEYRNAPEDQRRPNRGIRSQLVGSGDKESSYGFKGLMVQDILFSWERRKARVNGYGYDFSAVRNELLHTEKDDELYVRNLSTGTSRLLVKMAGGLRIFGPRYSPDGSTIGFTASGPDAFPEDVYLVNADGSGLRKITQSALKSPKPGESRVYVRYSLSGFSPTGGRLLVRSWEGGNTFLGIMSTAGGELEILGEGCWNAFWSSDEKKVYCFDAPKGIMAAFELDTKTRNVSRIHLGWIVAHAPDRDEVIIGKGGRFGISATLHSLAAPPADIQAWASGKSVNLEATERMQDPKLLRAARKEKLPTGLEFSWARWVTRDRMLVVQGNQHFERVEIRRVAEMGE